MTTLHDLKKQRAKILELAEAHKAHDVRIFGSVARGDIHEDSDIDFLVRFTPDYTLRDLIRLTTALQALLGQRVDIANEEDLREELRPYILRDAVPL